MKNVAHAAAVLVAGAGFACAEPSVERGEYLVQGPMGCGNCHTPFGAKGLDMSRDLAGREVEETEHFIAISANITPAGRVSDWSDEELGRAIRECIRPDGTVIGPPMPCLVYRGLGDEDLASVVMYLRTVPPVENDPGQSTYKMPLPPAYGPPVGSVTAPERAVSVEYGAYLASSIAHCVECHSPIGPEGPMLDAAHLGAGGYEFVGPWGTVVGPNITSHEDGLSGFSDDEIKTMVARGERPDGSRMLPPMPYPYFARLTGEDLDALVMYVRTLPPLPDP
ncbi:cytochrome c [Ruegeria sediminis]|uniref:Cytochrome c n=1 Tax=Ruegeria sediminis TaxID=2583820 RepID=A0ABY2WXI3_9RHOB|nr:c-type cytochrome [Ruegeria sediminis]TMV07573.1 cytochrome c [Ruegeria sediminis]